MNTLLPLLCWLWERPTSKKYRMLAPRVFWYLLVFTLFSLFGYFTTEPFAASADKERFRSFYYDGWTWIGATFFVCSWIIHDYLSAKYSSSGSGRSSSDEKGVNYKDPLAKYMVILGLLSLITLTIAFFDTWAKS
jgi:hypothetical protein